MPPRLAPALRTAKKALFAAARMTGTVAAARWLQRGRLPILCYHSVVAAPLPGWAAAGGLHLSLARFRRQMELVARCYRVRPLHELVATLRRGDRLPQRSLAITFDDGYVDNLDGAAEVLVRLALPATIFLATDYVTCGHAYWWDELPALLSAAGGRVVQVEGWGRLDLRNAEGVADALAAGARLLRAATLDERAAALGALAAAVGSQPEGVPRPMTWDEARRAADVFTFGGHGASHRVLDAIPVAAALEDVHRCREKLELQLPGRWRGVFCYPEGRSSAEVRAGLPVAGWSAAVTARAQPADESLAGPREDPLLLPRIGVSAAMDENAFLAHAAGLRAALGRWQV